MNELNLNNKVALITGGAGVICSTMAKSLAVQGVKTVILDLNIDAAVTTAAEIEKESGTPSFGVSASVLDKNSLENAKKLIHEKFGTVDILINGAGGNSPAATTKVEKMYGNEKPEETFFGLQIEGFDKVFDLNFKGTLLPSMVFGSDMVAKKSGAIINISSMNSYRPLTKIPAYSAAKAAVNNFTQWLAVHFAMTGVRVNAIAPGFLITNQNRFLLIDEKTGEMTPVVCLKPVTLAGTTVKRASGYNAGYILNNKIGEGAFVSLAKAGDIIPEMQEVITPGHVENFPEVCPACGEKLSFDGIHLMCNNNTCIGRIARKLGSACAMLDLKDIGGKTIEPFAEEFENMYDLFTWVLRNENTDEVEKYGIKAGSRSHEIFVKAFKNIQSLTYSQVILMMGYDGVGRKLSEQVAKDYCGLEPDYKGHEKVLVEMFQDEDIRTYIQEAVSDLESLGVTIDKPSNNKDKNMKTIYVCLTGSPKDFGYKTKEEFISQFSNVEEVAVTDPRCNYLITNSLDSVTSKMKNAEKKGVRKVTYGTFTGR